MRAYPGENEVVKFDRLETRFLKIPAHIFTYLLGQAERLFWVAESETA
jgi:hypothetical protein